MANHIVAPTPGESSCATGAIDLDAVIVWLTRTIERDYIARCVFPEFRSDTAREERANATLHHLTVGQAQAMLDDAKHRSTQVTRSLKCAIHAHIDKLVLAMQEAKTRRAEREAVEPVCTYRSEWSENWRGTKEQLGTIGIALDGPYPGEQGGRRNWAQTQDHRGYSVRIRACKSWPGLFFADVTIPEHVHQAAKEKAKQQRSAQQRLQQLMAMPSTPDAFRQAVADAFWSGTMPLIEMRMQPSDGYRFTAATMDELKEAMTAAYWTIRNGETTGVSPREHAQRLMLAGARADASLQRFLMSVSTTA